MNFEKAQKRDRLRAEKQQEFEILTKKHERTFSKLFDLLRHDIDQQQSDDSKTNDQNQLESLKSTLNSVEGQLMSAFLIPFDESQITFLDNVLDGALQKRRVMRPGKSLD